MNRLLEVLPLILQVLALIAWLVWMLDLPIWIKRFAPLYLPVRLIGWAINDPDELVRYSAAVRLPLDKLEWALHDRSDKVRHVALFRLIRDFRESGGAHDTTTRA